jgi:hypothetical protein
MNAVVRNLLIVVSAVVFIAAGTGIWHFQLGGISNNGSATGGGVVIGTNPCVAGAVVNGNLLATFQNYRTSIGIPVANNVPSLAGTAQARLTDMVTNNYVGPINSQGQDITTELASKGVSFTSAGLLIYKGCLGNPADQNNAIVAWLADPSSAALLNNPNWNDCDVATTFVILNPSAGTGYYLNVIVLRQ